MRAEISSVVRVGSPRENRDRCDRCISVIFRSGTFDPGTDLGPSVHVVICAGRDLPSLGKAQQEAAAANGPKEVRVVPTWTLDPCP